MAKKIEAQDVTERFILNFGFRACEREILKVIYEIRIVSTEDLANILGRERKYVQNALARLYSNGFLYKLKLTKEQGAFSNGLVYWMLDRGGAFIYSWSIWIDFKNYKLEHKK